MNKGLFTSNRSDWETPQALFDYLNEVFHFTLDAAANSDNHKCEKYYSPAFCGLNQSWFGNVWLNPPYGREIGKWVEKAYKESQTNADRVVCLLPARTDTKWFHSYCSKAELIMFVKGRLKFSNSGPAPFPSMVVVFQKDALGPTICSLNSKAGE